MTGRTPPGMTGLPPYALGLGMVLVDPAEDGVAEAADALIRLPVADRLLGRPGFLHGGAIAGLLEMAAHVALQRALDLPVRVKPITVTVDFMRGGRERATYAGATILRLGKRIANVEATAWQVARDTPIAAARLTLLLDRTTSDAMAQRDGAVAAPVPRASDQ